MAELCLNIHFSYKDLPLPFISDAHSGIDGAGEGDVVEGEEELGEDVSVESGLVPERPLPNWKYK